MVNLDWLSFLQSHWTSRIPVEPRFRYQEFDSESLLQVGTSEHLDDTTSERANESENTAVEGQDFNRLSGVKLDVQLHWNELHNCSCS